MKQPFTIASNILEQTAAIANEHLLRNVNKLRHRKGKTVRVARSLEDVGNVSERDYSAHHQEPARHSTLTHAASPVTLGLPHQEESGDRS
jgi:hypothetical protein